MRRWNNDVSSRGKKWDVLRAISLDSIRDGCSAQNGSGDGGEVKVDSRLATHAQWILEERRRKPRGRIDGEGKVEKKQIQRREEYSRRGFLDGVTTWKGYGFHNRENGIDRLRQRK